MNRIRLYILTQFLQKLCVVLAIVIGATILVDIVEQLRVVGSDVKLSLLEAFRLAILKLPMLLESVLAFVLLATAILCYSQLNNRSELAVFRSVGMSAWQFILPAAIFSVLLGALNVMVINPIGAVTQTQFNELRDDLLGREAALMSNNDGIWLKQESDTSLTFINAQSVEENAVTFNKVRMVVQERVFEDGVATEGYMFDKRIDAETAQIFEGFWQLTNVTEYTLDAPAKKFDTLSIPSTIDPSVFLRSFASPATIGFWRLPQFIKQTRKAGLNTLRYESRWHGLLSTPALFLAMTLVGALACLRLPRAGGAFILIGAGAGIAFALYFFTQFSNALGISGAVPIWVAAWTPSVVAILLALWYLSLKEDG